MTPSRPTASYEDKVIKPEPPTTPPSFPRRFNLIPATPKKKRSRTITQIHPSAPLFKLQLPSAKQPLFQNLYDGGGLIKKKCEAYSTFKGQTFPLVQQPTASKSCGAGAVMMLTLGCFQKQDPQNALMTAKQFIHENADDFWRWYASCQLTRPCEIQEVLLRYFKINTEKHEISSENFDDCVQKLRASLSESNHSVMLSIT
ncbi:MAG: hypothetical protein KDK50_06225, partial [Chlamydiia bacterium]|nr:hypothetical protein [Chlamydiia bacterium]